MPSRTDSSSTISARIPIDGSSGPDRAGNLLEIVVLISSDGNEFVIHAMPMRPKYRKLLEP